MKKAIQQRKALRRVLNRNAKIRRAIKKQKKNSTPKKLFHNYVINRVFNKINKKSEED